MAEINFYLLLINRLAYRLLTQKVGIKMHSITSSTQKWIQIKAFTEERDCFIYSLDIFIKLVKIITVGRPFIY